MRTNLSYQVSNASKALHMTFREMCKAWALLVGVPTLLVMLLALWRREMSVNLTLILAGFSSAILVAGVVYEKSKQLWEMLQWLKGNSSATRENTVIALLSHFLCERARIEWMGDLYEMRMRWQEQGLSRWGINLRTFGVLPQLLLAQARCMVYDRVIARYWGKSL